MSDVNTNMADLDSDDMGMVIAVQPSDAVEEQNGCGIADSGQHPVVPINSLTTIYQCDRKRNRLGSVSGSDAGKEESNIDSSNELLVSGSANTVDATKACLKECLSNDCQKSAFRAYQPNHMRKDSLVITGKHNAWPVVDKKYMSRRKTFDSRHWPSELSAEIMANAGMIYRGPCSNSNGEIVYDMVECYVCHQTMNDFHPDEDPLVKHWKLHQECKRFQE